MYCTVCGTKSKSGHSFCTACGTELKETASKDRVQRKPSSKKWALVISAFALVGLLFLAVTVTNVFSKSTAQVQGISGDILIQASEFNFPLETYNESDWSFEGEMYKCKHSAEFDQLIANSEVIGQNLLSHRGEVQIDFDLREALLIMQSESDAERLEKLLFLATEDCSQLPNTGEFENGGPTYLDYQTAQEAYGLAVEGSVIKRQSTICLEGCFPSWLSELAVVRKGAYVLVMSHGYSQNEGYEKVSFAETKLIRYKELKDNIPALVARFNG